MKHSFIIALCIVFITFTEAASLSPQVKLADRAESSTSEGGELKRRTPSSFNNDDGYRHSKNNIVYLTAVVYNAEKNTASPINAMQKIHSEQHLKRSEGEC
jgi:hypothetical protein